GGNRVDEGESCNAVQLGGGAGGMSQYEEWSMKHGVVAPPAFPLGGFPRSALWSALFAPHELGAEVRPPVTCKRLVDPCVSARLVVHLVEGSCGDEPLHQSASGVSEGRLETLSLSRAEPVEGNREVVDAHLRHRETCSEPQSATFARGGIYFKLRSWGTNLSMNFF